MPLQRIARPAAMLLLAACGSEPRAGSPDVFHACTSCVDGGLAAGGSGGSGGSAGSDVDAAAGGQGTVPDAGQGGAPPLPDPVCGNGVVEAGEECDGADFGELSCQSYGFSDGGLSCGDDCVADSSGCSGVEACADGADNDGDGAVDCADPDCADACADACSAPATLQNSLLTTGRVEGHESPTDSSCAASPEQSGLVAYSYTPPLSGVLDIFVESSQPVSLSVRGECTLAFTERECEQTELGTAGLAVAVTEGEPLYVLVESLDRTLPATYRLVATARPIVCGDGYVDGAEECDDGNFNDDDGCSNACDFQSSEDEPNGNSASADPYVEPAFYGRISSRNDRDTVSIQVPQGYMLVAETWDLGDGACARLETDSYLELFNDQGELVEQDDDGGIGFCAALVAEGLDAGEYFVRVSASGASSSFFYELGLSLLPP